MFLSRIVIRNFRNFKRVDVPISEGLTCISGPNNVGKTNLLHAIRLAADVGLSHQDRLLTLDDIHGSAKDGGAHHVLVSLEFDGLGTDSAADGMTAGWMISDTRARITFRFRPKRVARQQVEDKERTVESLRMEDHTYDLVGGGQFDPFAVGWKDEVGSTAEVFQILQQYRVFYLPALRDVEHDLEYAKKSPLLRLLRQMDIPESERAEIAKFVADANDRVAAHKALKALGDHISASQARAAGNAFAQKVRIGLTGTSFDSVSRSLAPLVSSPGGREFPVELNGLGLNNILYVAMLLQAFALERAKASAAGHLILCEEPEAHLHPELQVSLMRSIREAGPQALVTTHSTHIAVGTGLRTCVTLTQSPAGATRVTAPVVGAALPDSVVEDLDRYLDATRSRLLFARGVLLVEGPAELLLVSVLAKKVLNLDLDGAGICVVPVFGTHFDAFTALFKQGGLEKRCAVLADGDLDPLDDVDDGLALVAEDSPVAYLGGEYVRTFACRTTFERTLARPGLLSVIAATVAQFKTGKGARTAKQLRIALKPAIAFAREKDLSYKPLLPEIRSLTLKAAKRVGKGRFAQTLARHAAKSARSIPPYLKSALNWVSGREPD